MSGQDPIADTTRSLPGIDRILGDVLTENGLTGHV